MPPNVSLLTEHSCCHFLGIPICQKLSIAIYRLQMFADGILVMRFKKWLELRTGNFDYAFNLIEHWRVNINIKDRGFNGYY